MPTEPVRTDYALAELDRRSDRPSLVTLYLDGVESSALDLDDPTYLEFEYMQQFRCILEAMYPKREPLRVLHLGAAGCAFPRALDAARPGSRQLAAEIDGKLATYVREWFDLPPSPRLRIRVQDARVTLDTTAARWDVVVRDAFADRDVPSHLRTGDAAARVAQVLQPEGVYLLNSVASTGLTRFANESRALLENFEHVLAIMDPAVLRGRRFGNIVLAASQREFAFAQIERLVRRLPLPARMVGRADLRRRARGAILESDADIGYVPAGASAPGTAIDS
ncbi:fused MFS/spermidine synthase [Actinotignum timonense]|nr:fused MFS/spermidine synthase [Actinotignum timonense]MDK6906578.1 fused MFS/spermidine synthase [Actinotignum timonense]